MQPYRLIILGAGFSRPAGMPLARDLWREITKRSKRLEGRASKLNDDLRNYIEFRESCTGHKQSAARVNFEEFMSFLDIEHFLGLRGSDTWSDDGNEGTVVVKTLIGKILAECQRKLEKIPELYLEFARRLEPSDIVLTFNYDTLLESALDEIGKPYRLFTTRYTDVTGQAGAIALDTEVAIHKLHGSIDWFDKQRLEEWGVNLEALELQPIVDGPMFETEPLLRLHRARNLAEAYRDGRLFKATPAMLSPSAMKFAYAPRLTSFMHGLNRAGILNFGMTVIGYSLPAQDQYALQIIHRLVTNYQENYWEKPAFDRKKTPLVIVDKLDTQKREAAFRKRYQFVNWDRAELISTGFDGSSLDRIFAKH